MLVGLQDERGYPRKTTVDSADTRIHGVGNALWRAMLPNPDGLLMPGMLVRVRLVTSDPYQALLVWNRAVLDDQEKKFVFIVTDQNVVQRRDVEIGPQEDDGMRIVEKGLTVDDWVVETDTVKVRGEHGEYLISPKQGMPVKPKKPAAVPPSSSSEKPGAKTKPGGDAPDAAKPGGNPPPKAKGGGG